MKVGLKLCAVLGLLLPIVLQGQACSPMSARELTMSSVGEGTGVSPLPGVPLPEEDLKPLGSARIVHKHDLLSSTLTVLDQPYSDRLYDVYNQVSANLSDDGFTDSVSAPMMNSLLSIHGSACDLALANEQGKPDADRKIFKGFVFDKPPQSQAATAVPNLIRTLARRAWLRSETDVERNMILESSKIFDGTAVEDTRRKALFVCSAILTSLDSVAR